MVLHLKSIHVHASLSECSPAENTFKIINYWDDHSLPGFFVYNLWRYTCRQTGGAVSALRCAKKRNTCNDFAVTVESTTPPSVRLFLQQSQVYPIVLPIKSLHCQHC